MIDLSVNPFKLIKGDVVLLCSDGLTKIMSDAQICDLVNQYKDDTKELAELLPLTAADMCVGSQDNTTVAVICYK
jgi:serine/threonine protein phosphatase PrpC